MKKICSFMILMMITFAGVNAQSCCSKKSADTKSCAAKSTTDAKADVNTKVAAMYVEADKIANADENIQKRVCAFSGTVTYYQKIENTETKNNEWVEVTFDEKNKEFTRVASAYMVKDLEKTEEAPKNKSAEKACCKKGEKACCKKSGV